MATISDSNALDLLDQAASMLQFLADIAPALTGDGQHTGLNANSAFGLGLFLDHINTTIDQAKELIG